MLIHMNCGDQHLTVELEYPLVEQTIRVDFGRSFALKELKKDAAGKPYFVWNNTRMYLDYLQEYTMASLQKKLDANEWIRREDLILAIINDGIDSVRFVTPCNVRSFADIFGIGVFSSDTEDVVCKIVEDRYKVAEGYKLGVVPEIADNRYAGRDYYTDDFVSLLKSGRVRIKLNEPVTV